MLTLLHLLPLLPLTLASPHAPPFNHAHANHPRSIPSDPTTTTAALFARDTNIITHTEGIAYPSDTNIYDATITLPTETPSPLASNPEISIDAEGGNFVVHESDPITTVDAMYGGPTGVSAKLASASQLTATAAAGAGAGEGAGPLGVHCGPTGCTEG